MKMFMFREKRIEDSLGTAIGVLGLYDMKLRILAVMPEMHNVRITLPLERRNGLPEEWGEFIRYVLADNESGDVQCVGMCNFYED